MRRAIVLASTAIALVPSPAFAAAKQSFAIHDASGPEDAGRLPVKVCKVGPNQGISSDVHLSVAGSSSDTAKAGTDFTPIDDLHLEFTGALLCQTVDLILTNDQAPEPSKFVTATITAGKNARLYDGKAKLTITDSDAAAPPPPPLPEVPPVEEQTCPDGLIIPAATTCPVVVPPPTPPPPPPPPTAPEITLDGQPYQPTLDHNVSADLGTAPIPKDNGADPVGAYRQICFAGQLLYDDPIIWPGQPGKSHLHEYSGNTKASGNSTYVTLRQSGESTCNLTLTGFAAQRSAYWISAVLDEFGNVRRPNFNSAYYKQIPKSSLSCGPPNAALGKVGLCVGTPNGIKMVTGNLPDGAPPPANLRTDVGRQVYLYCSGAGAVGSHAGDLAELKAKSPICPTLNVVISFPSCWKGPPYLDSPDHTSHVAYQRVDRTTGRSVCPLTHPYLITGIRLDYQYSTGPDGPWNWRLSSDPAGAPAFSTEHGDVWVAWDDDVLDEMEDNCINKHLDCNGGNLGSGRVLIGASEPTYIINGVPTRTFVNPNPVEPMPPGPMAMAH